MKRLILAIGILSTLLSGCSNATSISSNNNVLTRLNSAGNLHWVEDPSSDMTGSNSLAVYIEGTTNGCAVWVFHDDATANASLTNGLLDFPGQQIYEGADTQSGLGIIVVSPYAGADCEFVAAKVFGWGK